MVHNFERYEFELSFDIPVTYPAAPPALALPELDGKTEKMYRGGLICLDAHFQVFFLWCVTYMCLLTFFFFRLEASVDTK